MPRTRIAAPDGVALQPAARPLGNYVQPARTPVGETAWGGLARGLTNLNAGLLPFLGQRADEAITDHIQQQQQAAELEMRNNENREKFRKAVASGAILPGQNPHKLRAMKYLSGVYDAEKYAMSLEATLHDAPMTDADSLNTFLEKARSEFDARNTDPEMRAGFLAASQQVEQRFRAQQQQKRIQQLEVTHALALEDRLDSLIHKNYSPLIGLNADFVAQAGALLDDTAKDEGPVGRTKANELLIERLIQYAEYTGDDRVLTQFQKQAGVNKDLVRKSIAHDRQIADTVDRMAIREEERYERQERREHRAAWKAMRDTIETDVLAPVYQQLRVDPTAPVDVEGLALRAAEITPVEHRLQAAQHVRQMMSMLVPPDKSDERLDSMMFPQNGDGLAAKIDALQGSPTAAMDARKLVQQFINEKGLKGADAARLMAKAHDYTQKIFAAQSYDESTGDRAYTEAQRRDAIATQAKNKAMVRGGEIVREEAYAVLNDPVRRGEQNINSPDDARRFIKDVLWKGIVDEKLSMSEQDAIIYSGQLLKEYRESAYSEDSRMNAMVRSQNGEMTTEELDRRYLAMEFDESTYLRAKAFTTSNDEARRLLTTGTIPDFNLQAERWRQYVESTVAERLAAKNEQRQNLEDEVKQLSNYGDVTGAAMKAQQANQLAAEIATERQQLQQSLNEEFNQFSLKTVRESLDSFKKEPQPTLEKLRASINGFVDGRVIPVQQERKAVEEKRVQQQQKQEKAVKLLGVQERPDRVQFLDRLQQVASSRHPEGYAADTFIRLSESLTGTGADTPVLEAFNRQADTALYDTVPDNSSSMRVAGVARGPKQVGMHPANIKGFGQALKAAQQAAATGDAAAVEQANDVVRQWADVLMGDDPTLYTSAFNYLDAVFKTPAMQPLAASLAGVPSVKDELARKKSLTEANVGGAATAEQLTKRMALATWPSLFKDKTAFGKTDQMLVAELAQALHRTPEEIPQAALDALRVVSYRNNTHNLILTARGYGIDELMAGKLGGSVDLTKINIRASNRELDEKLPSLLEKFGYTPEDRVKVKSAILKNREALLLGGMTNE